MCSSVFWRHPPYPLQLWLCHLCVPTHVHTVLEECITQSVSPASSPMHSSAPGSTPASLRKLLFWSAVRSLVFFCSEGLCAIVFSYPYVIFDIGSHAFLPQVSLDFAVTPLADHPFSEVLSSVVFYLRALSVPPAPSHIFCDFSCYVSACGPRSCLQPVSPRIQTHLPTFCDLSLSCCPVATSVSGFLPHPSVLALLLLFPSYTPYL